MSDSSPNAPKSPCSASIATEQVEDSARSVVISVNPKAGAKSGQNLVDLLENALVALGLRVSVVHDQTELRERTADLLDAGALRAVVCAGGDGTLAFVANAVAAAAPLVILPLGTENLFAKYLGLAPDPAKVAQVVADGLICKFDAGLATSRQESEKGEPGRIFTLMAGVGFDADVVRQVHEGRTGHIRHWSYAKPIWSSIRRYQYPEIRVSVDDDGYSSTGTLHATATPSANAHQEQVIRARWVFVANLPRYAGNLQIVPDACGWDGLLDICTFKRGSLWKGLQYLTAILFRRHRNWKSDVRHLRARKLRIESSATASYQLDGDYGGELPLEIEVLPQRLTMLVPSQWLEKQQS